MSAAMAETAPGRRSELFDSFEGLPAAGELDGAVAHQWVASGRTLVAPEEAADAAMRRSGSSDYRIVRGWFDQTVPEYALTTPQIAVLRLDGDWYESTMCCLELLFPCVADGGVVILDDYGFWEGCTRAVHDYLSAEKRTEPIQHTRRGVAFITKGSGQAPSDS
jgi:O-methyltransferase